MDFFAGKRAPLICIPLTGKNKDEIKDELQTIIPQHPDLIEWRVDFLDGIVDTEYVLTIADMITNTSDIPTLVTIRSEKEGGEKIPLSEDEKVNLLCDISKRTKVDLLDFEVLNKPEYIHELRRQTSEQHQQLILSCHHFEYTPSNTIMMEHMCLAESYGADLAKMAAMPRSKDDVLRLLEWTRQADKALHIPVISMSMGQIGSLSRIVGWAYGSMITFGVGKQSSAPGQIPVGKLRELIDSTQAIVGAWE